MVFLRIANGVEDSKGITKLLEGLPVRLKGSGETKTIGVVVDADVSIGSRWQQIRDILVKSNLYADIPEECPSNGLILKPINSDDIKIGVWIMPNNNNNGMLEDFAAFLIPDDDKLLPEVENVLDSIEVDDDVEFDFNLALLALILTGEDYDSVVGSYVKLIHFVYLLQIKALRERGT